MQIGIIGLGRMGSNISRRLMKAGHRCVLVKKPRAVWVMLPAGRITEETVERLGHLLEPDNVIIDSGNSFYQDDIRCAKNWPRNAFATSIAARPAASGASSAATA